MPIIVDTNFLCMLSFLIEKDGKEFHIWCPELKGCHSHGKTRAEAMQNLKDAIALYLEDTMEEDILEKDLSIAS